MTRDEDPPTDDDAMDGDADFSAAAAGVRLARESAGWSREATREALARLLVEIDEDPAADPRTFWLGVRSGLAGLSAPSDGGELLKEAAFGSDLEQIRTLGLTDTADEIARTGGRSRTGRRWPVAVVVPLVGMAAALLLAVFASDSLVGKGGVISPRRSALVLTQSDVTVARWVLGAAPDPVRLSDDAACPADGCLAAGLPLDLGWRSGEGLSATPYLFAVDEGGDVVHLDGWGSPVVLLSSRGPVLVRAPRSDVRFVIWLRDGPHDLAAAIREVHDSPLQPASDRWLLPIRRQDR